METTSQGSWWGMPSPPADQGGEINSGPIFSYASKDAENEGKKARERAAEVKANLIEDTTITMGKDKKHLVDLTWWTCEAKAADLDFESRQTPRGEEPEAIKNVIGITPSAAGQGSSSDRRTKRSNIRAGVMPSPRRMSKPEGAVEIVGADSAIYIILLFSS